MRLVHPEEKQNQKTLITQKTISLPVSEGRDNQTATVPQIFIAIDKFSIDSSDVQVPPHPVVSNDEWT